MKTLKESILDQDFDTHLDPISLLSGPKQPLFAGEHNYGFMLTSKNGPKLVETILLALEAEGAKEKSFSSAMSAIKRGKCAAFVTEEYNDKLPCIHLVTKPDPTQKSNINNLPFLRIKICPRYDSSDISVATEHMRRPGASLGLPREQFVIKSYIVPNKLYADILKYVIDNNNNSAPAYHDTKARKQWYYEICDTVSKR